MIRLLIATSLITLTACESTRYRYTADRVDPALLQYAPDGERDKIAEARRARDEAADAVAAAKLRVEQAERGLEVARQGKVVAVAEENKAEAEHRARLAEAGYRDNGRLENGVAENGEPEAVRRAADEVELAEARIDWHEERIAAAKAEVDLAKARLDLREAEVALAEARALRLTDRPEAERLDMLALERAIRERQTEVEVAEVRLDACQREVDLAERRASGERMTDAERAEANAKADAERLEREREREKAREEERDRERLLRRR